MLPKERQFSYGGKKFFVTHGHYYSVASGYHRVLEEAKSRGCDFAIYGHTHMPFDETFESGLAAGDEVRILNPGSISSPRGGSKKSYMIMTFDNENGYKVELKKLQGGSK